MAIEKQFDQHESQVALISVDKISNKWGAKRLVFSYDTSQVVLIWDLFTGGKIVSFKMVSRLKIAAWMKNGMTAFGRPNYARVNRC